MALFPKIQSPCPYKGNIADILDDEVCRLCKRQVHDLTFMTDGERVDFMRSCKEEVCVRYTVRPAIAAAALAAAAIVAPTAAAACDTVQVEEIIMVGGVKKPADVTYVHYADTQADRAIPMLPVVYDDPPSAKDKPTPVKAPAAP